MSNKQTAVEWLFHQLWEEPKDKFTWYAILEKAKEMDKNKQKELITEIMQEDQKDGLYKKQTAVSWLVSKLELDTRFNGIYNEIIKEAKEKEKDQITKAACFEPFLGDHPLFVGEEYYRENYA